MPSAKPRKGGPLYIIEHMEEGLEKWCKLEYRHICQIISPERVIFLKACFDAKDLVDGESSPPTCMSEELETLLTKESANTSLPDWDRICLLDMDADEALEPDDVCKFDALVFGGILGNITTNDDGTYGSDDRTSEIRRLGFKHRRHLGPMQMTTDTAVLVSRMVLEEARVLADIPFIDSPEIDGEGGEGGEGGKECVCMEGFRYVVSRGANFEPQPIMPDGMRDLLASSADDDILGSL